MHVERSIFAGDLLRHESLFVGVLYLYIPRYCIALEESTYLCPFSGRGWNLHTLGFVVNILSSVLVEFVPIPAVCVAAQSTFSQCVITEAH